MYEQLKSILIAQKVGPIPGAISPFLRDTICPSMSYQQLLLSVTLFRSHMATAAQHKGLIFMNKVHREMYFCYSETLKWPPHSFIHRGHMTVLNEPFTVLCRIHYHKEGEWRSRQPQEPWDGRWLMPGCTSAHIRLSGKPAKSMACSCLMKQSEFRKDHTKPRHTQLL